MRKFALLSLLLLAGIGQAQMSAREMVLGKKIFVALRPEVKAELKITDDQDRKIKDTFGDALQVDGDRMMITIMDATDLDQLAKDALKVLNADQIKRLDEVWIQQSNGNAIADEAVSKELKLTDEQKKRIEKLLEDAGSELADLFHSGPDEDAGKKAKAITSKSGQKMIEILDDTQKKRFEELKGKPFKFKEIMRA